MSPPTSRPAMLALLHVFACFFVLCSADNGLSNLLTSLLPAHLGAITLAVTCVSVAAGVFVAPHVVWRIGESRTMLLGAVSFVLFMASVIRLVTPVLIVASIVFGADVVDSVAVSHVNRLWLGAVVDRVWVVPDQTQRPAALRPQLRHLLLHLPVVQRRRQPCR